MVVDKITRQNTYTNNRRRFSVEANQTITWLLITLTALIVGLSLSYIYLKSRSAQQAYLLSQIQEDRTNLQNQNQGLNAKLVDALSFQSIEETDQVKVMGEAENKTFVEPPQKPKKTTN